MQPLETKKSPKFLGQKNHSTSQDKKNHGTSRDKKKSWNLLGQKKSRNLSGQKKSRNGSFDDFISFFGVSNILLG